MLGAEKGDEFGYVVLGERVAEAGHFLAAVFDLSGDLRGLHVLADVGQGRTFLGALRCGSVAVSAALVAEKGGSGLLIRFRSERIGSVGEKSERAGSGERWKQTRKAQFKCSHRDYFLIDFWGAAPPLGG
jgi:hypothetical protein